MLRIMMMASSLILSTACVTLSQEQGAGSGKAGASKLSFSDTPVVHKTDGKPILQKLDRDRWIQVRKTSKNEHIKLYASLGTGEWDVAIADARAFLQDNPRDEVALTVLSLALTMKRNYSLAAYYARLLNEYHPGNPEVNNILGLSEMNKPGAKYEDYRTAISFFDKAFRASEQQIASGMNLAQLHLEMGNFEGARDVFAEVKDRCDSCIDASLGYGIALSRLNSYAKAEEVFEEILESDSHNAYALFYLALVAKYGRGDNQLAINRLSSLLQDPEVKNLEIQRKANFLLRRIQAQVYGQPKDAVAGKSKRKAAPVPSDATGENLEKVINAE